MLLSSLSVELIQEIAGHLETPAQVALRATCSTFCAALDPFVFSNLTVFVGRSTLERDLSRLRKLPAGSTPYSQYARNLYIKEVTPFFWSSGSENADSEVEEEKELWRTGLQEALRPALNGLDGVQTGRWAGSSLDPEWVVDVVVDALAKWQLRELVYESGMTETLPKLDRISGAALTRLSISVPSKPDLDASLVALLRHSPKLVSLTLSAPADLDLDTVWRALQSNYVQLAELTVTAVSLALCDYLTSYTGLERLVLLGVDASETSRQLAGQFFERVLQHQSASLVELRVAPHYTSAWSFGTHNVDALSSLVKLETLEIAVDPEYDDARLTKDIALLFDTVAHLPVLRTLEVETTMDECYRGQLMCGNGMMGHFKAVERRMRAAVAGYRYRGDQKFHATRLLHGRCFRMAEAEDGDGWVYVQFAGTRRLPKEELCEDDDSDVDY
uniref:F-box domain-containing protein n=1 Tax=Mycena chlorophos TaxID=658473 RepID=A0ABQ0LM84_MYCCL|nr:predicted protein [Mycena chlorophos]